MRAELSVLCWRPCTVSANIPAWWGDRRCATEIFTWIQIGKPRERIILRPIDDGLTSSSIFDNFDVAKAECSCPADRETLLSIIEASFGDIPRRFNHRCHVQPFDRWRTSTAPWLAYSGRLVWPVRGGARRGSCVTPAAKCESGVVALCCCCAPVMLLRSGVVFSVALAIRISNVDILANLNNFIVIRIILG